MMTENDRKEENGTGIHAAQYLNPVFEGDSPEENGINDITIVITDSTNDDNKKCSPDKEKFRNVSPSVSHSINYDDVISAENLTNNIALGDRSVNGGPKLKNNSPDQISQTPIPEEEEIFHEELVLKIRKHDRIAFLNKCQMKRLQEMNTLFKTMPLKNFHDEIRARRDLEKFLVSPVVLLDVTHTCLDQIIQEMLMKLKKDLEVDEKITSEAKKAFFTFHEKHKDSAGAVDHLRETIQGIRYRPEGAEYEQSWVTAVCSLPNLKRSHVGIARLRHPLNLGSKSEEVMLVIGVIAPKKEKFTKNAVEIGRTFASLMMNSSFRHRLINASTEEEFKDILQKQSSIYKKEIEYSVSSTPSSLSSESMISNYAFKDFGHGVYDDFRRRFPYYWSDFRDGVVGKHSLRKLLATTFFLYFACLLPDIAFGTLYETNTEGKMDVTSCIVSQTIGGLIFALCSGQPMLVLLTTAPLALYVKVIKLISTSFGVDFSAMYAMTGLWNSIFLGLHAFFNLSKYMKYSTRSTEEIFGFFIALAFCGDAVKATIDNFKKNYHFSTNMDDNTSDIMNRTIFETAANLTNLDCESENICYRPANSILFLFLMLSTLWLGLALLQFDKSQFLSSTKREMLADYALPISVLVMSFVGSYLFRDIPAEKFNYFPERKLFTIPSLNSLPLFAHLGAAGLGLCLSCLFYVDQNVSAALVNAPSMKLKKGPAYHWDLMVIGIINVPLSIFTLPWVHAALPHSPLHVKALADVEQHVSNVGIVQDEIVKVRETRLTTIFSHILIGLSLLIIPVLQYVPVAVLQGLFLYLGLSSFIGNQLFDRLALIFTEGSSYPPNHYVRKVPQRKLHIFTACQVLQLMVVAVFGFVDIYYLKMIFPVIILLLLPIRHKILPKIIEHKYLAVLDA